MVSIHALSAIVRWFDPGSGQTKHCEIGICCFSAYHAILMNRNGLVSTESIYMKCVRMKRDDYPRGVVSAI